MSECLLRNLRLVDYGTDTPGDLLIRDGKIAAVGSVPDYEGKTIDCGGKVLMPSFVDLHAHFRDPGFTHKEDIHSGCRAAAHGGYTAVHTMANTKPVCSDAQAVRYVRNKAQELGLCDVFQCTSITKGFDGRTLSHLEELHPETRWLSDDGVGVAETGVMLEAMRLAREKGVGVMLHEEDAALTKVDSYLMEELMTFRDVKLAGLTGCPTHFCHVSTIEAMTHILNGKRDGAPVTCEVTPHHLLLTDANGGKVAPPLRSEEHRLHLIDAVRNGYVDAISTDHAPHTPQDKQAGANGFTGLDTAFAVSYTALVKPGHINLMDLSALLSCGPNRLMKLDGGKLEAGRPANLVLVDPDRTYTVTEQHIFSKSKNSPFLGMELSGEVLMTIKEGTIVYDKNIDGPAAR